MLAPSPLDVVVAFLLSIRRFGFGRTVLGSVLVGVGIQPLLPPVTCSCFGPTLRRCDNSLRYLAGVRSDLKNLASREEIYFADTGRYTADREALGFVTSSGVRLSVRATADGWSAWATHAVLGEEEGCVLAYRVRAFGPDAPGWVESGPLSDAGSGELVCTR